MRVLRNRGWRLFCLLALLLPIVSSTVTAQGALPGVRNRLYESPTFRFTMVWDNTVWTPVASTSVNRVDQLVLESTSTRFTVDAAPKTQTAQQCAAAAVNAVTGLAGTHDVLTQPEVWGEAVVRTRGTDAQGTAFDVIRDIQCMVPDDQTYQITYVHLVWTNRFDADESLPNAIKLSLLPPDGSTDVSQRPPHEIMGIMQVTDLINSLSVEIPPGSQSVSLTFELLFENVDSFDSQIEVSRLLLNGAVPPDRVVWLLDRHANAPILTFPTGSSAVGHITFVVPAVEAEYDLCYQTRDGTDCVWLAQAIVGGVIGGGSGYRPRIDPGR